jgi:Caspase domain
VGLRDDHRDKLDGGPGIHAFIAGVSDYRHLGGGSDTAAAETYNFESLKSTARTAWLFYDWLKRADAAKRLPLPLATVHLLLSPSKSEPDLAATGADRCSWTNFASDADSWRNCASASNDDIALFYFAGHGIGRNAQESLLLMDDVGAKPGVFLSRAVDVLHLHAGMAPPADHAKSIARTQFYFIDACRTPISELRNFTAQGIPPLWNIEIDSEDNRAAPIFFGALPGTAAYASNQTQTLFSHALLECFDRLGADEPDVSDTDERWRVTVTSLTRSLPFAIAEVRKQFKVEQDWAPGGLPKDATFVYLNDRPLTTVTMIIDPPEAKGYFSFVVQPDEPGPTAAAQPIVISPIDPHPHNQPLPVGLYQFAARFTKNDPRYKETQQSIAAKLPASRPWRAKVTP